MTTAGRGGCVASVPVGGTAFRRSYSRLLVWPPLAWDAGPPYNLSKRFSALEERSRRLGVAPLSAKHDNEVEWAAEMFRKC